MATKSGNSKVNQASTYKSNKQWEVNRKKRLERTIKNQPNNEQAKLALKGMVYRRKTPKTREWSASWIAVAKLFKLFGGRFDRAIMSSSVETARLALQKQSPIAAMPSTSITPQTSDKGFFCILSRVNMA